MGGGGSNGVSGGPSLQRESPLGSSRPTTPRGFIEVVPNKGALDAYQSPVVSSSSLFNRRLNNRNVNEADPVVKGSLVLSDTVYEAKYDYKGSTDAELVLSVGDIVEVIEKQEAGWWRGVCRGEEGGGGEERVGWFPMSYVKPTIIEEKEGAGQVGGVSGDKETEEVEASGIIIIFKC